MKTANIITATFSSIILATYVHAQGSLTPPGAPTPGMKTLEQVEPRIDLAMVAGDATYHHVISQPGSYYLGGNLAVTKTSGIYINAAGVTLDLNGFEISRASGSGGYGIYIRLAGDRATVRNGSITGFQYGIISDSIALGCLFENLSASGCSSYGIEAGASSRIIDCRAHENLGTGIYAGEGSSLSGCTAQENQGNYGIYAGFGSSLIGCTAYFNKGSYGIYAAGGSSLSDCTAYNNQGKGSSSYGIYAAESTVVGCIAKFNSNTNSPGTSSQGIGIYVGRAGTVKDCTVSLNKGDGIRITEDSVVSGNTCDSNGNGGDGAGIHATSSDNRIENNNLTDNDRGIDVDIAGNFIVRNSASGNTLNWNVASGNVCLVVQAATAGAISGNSGGTAPGSTDPNANFTY